MKKVLVTGGAGFIGSHIVDRYLKEGWDVVVVDNLSTGKRKHIPKKAKFYQMDIRDEKLSEVFLKEKFDLINHHAAQINVRTSVEKPLFDAEINILGTLNLLTNCIKHRVNKFIFISSGGAIYGEPDDLPVNEYYPKNPFSPYGISKHTIEHYLYYFKQNFGLNYISLRYGNVYGPRQDPYGEAGVISIFTQKMLSGERPSIFGDGEQLRDYIYVDEVVDINMLVSEEMETLNKKRANSPDDLAYNIGTGRGSSVNLLYKLLSDATGFKKSPIYALKEINWQSKITLPDGLTKTVEWFRKSL